MHKNIIKVINREFLLQALSQIFFGMIGTFLILSFIYKTPLMIATVNITGLEDTFIQETSHQSLNETEKKQTVAMFAKVLNQTMVKIAAEKHLVLVPSQAVIAGSIDLTQEVAAQIKKGINA